MEDRMNNDPAELGEGPGFQLVTQQNEGGYIVYLREIDGISGSGPSEQAAAHDLVGKLLQRVSAGEPTRYRKPEPLDDSLGSYVVKFDFGRGTILLLEPEAN